MKQNPTGGDMIVMKIKKYVPVINNSLAAEQQN